jgi:hypothetical protein
MIMHKGGDMTTIKKMYNYLLKGGFFGFGSKPKKSGIGIKEINAYSGCDNEAKTMIEYSKTTPSFSYLTSNSEKSTLKSLHNAMNKAYQAHNKCSKDITETSKYKGSSNKKKYFIENPNFKYVKVEGASGYGTYFKNCKNKYYYSNKYTIKFMLYLMSYMNSFMNTCLNLKYPTEQLKGVKCIIGFLNNSEFMNMIFGSNSNDNLLSSQFSEAKNSELKSIRMLLSGGITSSSGIQQQSKETLNTLGDLDLDIYFTNKERNEKYRKFITIVKDKIKAAYDRLKTDYAPYKSLF